MLLLESPVHYHVIFIGLSGVCTGLEAEIMSEAMKYFNLILLCYFVQVHAQNLSCRVNGGVVSCPPVVCPGANVTFTATVQNLVGSNIWLLPTGTCSGSTPPDSILLNQIAGGCNGTTVICGPYTATNADPGNASIPCLTSTLSVTATSSMTSSVIQVGTRSLGGQNTIVNTTRITVIAPPGPVGNVTLNSPSVYQLTVAWAPPTTGGVPTSYNVSINDSSSPVVIPDYGSSLYTHTFTGLTSDTLYTISVVAINCAGTSNVTSTNRRTSSSPSPQTTSSVPLTSSTPTPTAPAPNAGASAIGAIVGGVVGGAFFLLIVVIIMMIVWRLCCRKLYRSTTCTYDNSRALEPGQFIEVHVPFKTTNSSTPATPHSVDRDSPPPPPRPSRDTPPPPPGPNTEAEYSTVDSSKKPQNQGMVYAEVGIHPPASSQQRRPAPNPSSQLVEYGQVRH